VWTASHQHGIDPFLILSLMRQESLYDVTAVSHAGAHGPMQILPRTAHLMALEFGDTEFMSPDLEDPASAIPYGVAYLGLLMERYQGSYPLALASYNGGPFNVAAWHAARGGDTPMDLWVELIPYRETRGYVKKVSRNYAIYIDLYGPKGASVQLPIVPRSQDPTVVDF
jgi:soluble lytic murein transglycosylase